MMHFPPVLDFPSYFRKFCYFLENFTNFPFSRKKFQFSSDKISDDLVFLVFFSHRPQISDFPLFCPVLQHFPPDSRKFIISPLFPKNSTAFYILYVCFPPTLTMMHLCITQCTYRTPLPKADAPKAISGTGSDR